MMRSKFNLLVVLSTITGISYLSLVPNPAGSSGGSVLLAIAFHLLAYFFLAGSLLLYFSDAEKGHLEAVTVAAVFGVLMELGQMQIPARAFSYTDIIVNSLGASVVLLDHRIGAVTKIVAAEDRILEEFLPT